MSDLTERLSGAYSIHLYLPFSKAAKTLRQFSRQLRGKITKHTQSTQLPSVNWDQLIHSENFRLTDLKKNNGNVRISELGILSLLAKQCPDHSTIFEIGTFDGRTTLNLAINSPAHCQIITLDLPSQTDTKFDVDAGETHFIDKPESGARYKHTSTHIDASKKITQQYGDSATFDFSSYTTQCSLIFVDGSHAYDYALSDTVNARKMIQPDGIIIWHDYGVWQGVTQALEEIEAKEQIGLKHIAGTSLVYWQCSVSH